MGVVRYLCITILLAVSLAAAQDCTGNGWKNVHGDCICNSGYDGPACLVNSGVCNNGALAAKKDRDDRFPILDETVNTITFRNNTLKLAIASEIVPKRKFDNITFLQQGSNVVADKCKLSGHVTDGSLWTQKAQDVANVACRDSFELKMHWANWQDCGFALQTASDPVYWIYRATFVITYTDDVGQPFQVEDSTYAPELFRHSSVSYKVYVRFMKSIEVVVNPAVTVDNVVGLKTAITKFDYNPANMKLTLGVSTIVLWPNMLVRETITLVIQDGSNTTSRISFDSNGNTTAMPNTVAASTAESTLYCNQTKYTNCLQYYEFDIHLDDGCDFNAIYIIGGIVSTCRDHVELCTSNHTEALLSVVKSDVCGKVTAEPMITGALQSYDELHNVKTEFEIGYKGFFEVDIATTNDFNMTWIDIWVVADVETTPATINDINLNHMQWLYKDGQVQLDGFFDYTENLFATPFAASPVDLVVMDVSKNSNSDIVYTPKFNFIFDSRIFHTPLSGTKKGYSLHARGKIVYAGNQQYAKRSEEYVDFVWQTDAQGYTGTARFDLAAQGSLSNVETTPSSSSSSYNMALLTSLAPVAGVALVVIGAAVIAAVVILKKKKNTYSVLSH